MVTERDEATEYDVVLHSLMERLTALQSLSSNVEETRRDASEALASVDGVAPLLKTVVDAALAAGTEVRVWQAGATTTLRDALGRESARLEAALRDAEARAQIERERATAAITSPLERLESDVAASLRVATKRAADMDARCAELMVAVEANSRSALDVSARAAAEAAARLDEFGSVFGGRLDASARAIDARCTEAIATVERQSRAVLDASARTATDTAVRLGEFGTTLLGRADATAREVAMLRATVKRLTITVGALVLVAGSGCVLLAMRTFG